MTTRRICTLIIAVLSLLPRAALAAPGTGIESFGLKTVDFLSNTLGPIVLAVGLAIAAYSLIFGSRDGIHRAIWVIVGGVLLFSVDSLVQFIYSAAR